MVTIVEYALMSGASYHDTRGEINRFPIPSGWNLVSRNPEDNATGFEASAFGNATTIAESTEIVISFAGTDPSSVADWLTNGGLAAGLGAWQLRQAAEYCMQVKAINPNANITFTGHSLGGGLAALMAVFFNEKAVTFDQAPFGNSANVLVATDLLTYLKAEFPVSTYPKIAAWLDPLDRIVRSVDGLSAREINVTNTIVQGGILEYYAALFLASEGGQSRAPLTHGTPDVGLMFDLHSQTLLSAFLQSEQSAAEGQSLSDVTDKLPDLLKMIFDESLYARSTDRNNRTEENFLDRLIRHESGNAPGASDTDMLSRFTTDLWKIAQDGGLTLTDNDLSKALIAFVMQMYYEKTTAADKYLFTAVSGGIRFDFNDVAGSLTAARGYQYFKDYLASLPKIEREAIAQQLPGLRDWYIQAGGDAMTASAADQRTFMLGGVGDDNLTGGSLADVLVGNVGADTLMGGGGGANGNADDNLTWRLAA